jgi:hypothetical protein
MSTPQMSIQDTLFGEAPAPKALTVKQPFASLIMAGIKDVENRTWKTNFRGTIVVHAGRGVANVRGTNIKPPTSEYPAGAIIGTVDIVGCVRDSTSEWAMDGHWHWLLANPRPCAPVPAAGSLGFWQIGADDWAATGLS